MKQEVNKRRACLNVLNLFKETFGADKIPPIIGTVFFGTPVLFINSCDQLQELYITKNKANTKHVEIKDKWFKLNHRSLLFQDSNDPDYPIKRKIVGGAFFKSKLAEMTKIIKICVLASIKDLQTKVESGQDVTNLADFTREMQGSIIISCSVGSDYAA